MIALFTKSIELLTAEDVTGVVGWPESLTVEFKEALPARDGRNDAWLGGGAVEQYARDKLFKEVVAFANTSGGHLLLGVAETKDAPPAAAALTPVPRCIDLAERLSRVAQVIDPPIPLLLVRGIPVQDDAGVVVFRVPASRAAPHRGPDKAQSPHRLKNGHPHLVAQTLVWAT
jgi:predicted HTH transcriptional regulator